MAQAGEMPKELERKLAAKYDKEDTSIKYKIMNSLGIMHGNKITKKGKRWEKKHKSGWGDI